jgi:hypothetical protein
MRACFQRPLARLWLDLSGPEPVPIEVQYTVQDAGSAVDYRQLRREAMNPVLASTGMTSDWMGTLEQGGNILRLLVHIRQAADGMLDGAMDNLDVGRMDVPIAVVMFQKAFLRFNAWTIDGSYEGKIARDGQTIEGTWRKGEDACPLVLCRIKPSHIDGIWVATLSYQSFRLRLVFYIASSPGGLIATMKSCDQSDAIVRMSSVKLIGRAIVLEADGIGAGFDGELDHEFRAIEGAWAQGGLGLPLSLKRIVQEEELRPCRSPRALGAVSVSRIRDQIPEREGWRRTVGHADPSNGRRSVSSGGADRRLRRMGPRRNDVRPASIPGSGRLFDAPRDRRIAHGQTWLR